LSWLQTVPGIGTIRRRGRLDEMHDLARFPRLQDFVSSGRLVTCAKEAAGKRYGTAGTKIGNADLQGACADAAVRFLRANPPGQPYRARVENTPGQGHAVTVLAHQRARAVDAMLHRHTAFAMEKFLHASRVGRVGEPTASLDLYGRRLERVRCKHARVALATAHEHIGRAACAVPLA
jgi:hypothetical protein